MLLAAASRLYTASWRLQRAAPQQQPFLTAAAVSGGRKLHRSRRILPAAASSLLLSTQPRHHPAAQEPHLALALVGGGVGGHEDDLIAGLDNALLHAARQHITHTLDLVDAGDGQAQGGVQLALGHLRGRERRQQRE